MPKERHEPRSLPRMINAPTEREEPVKSFCLDGGRLVRRFAGRSRHATGHPRQVDPVRTRSASAEVRLVGWSSVRP
jgi:hypothetical protein